MLSNPEKLSPKSTEYATIFCTNVNCALTEVTNHLFYIQQTKKYLWEQFALLNEWTYNIILCCF